MKMLIWLSAALAFLLVPASRAGAQGTPGDTWQVTIMPYLMGAGMGGTTAIAGQEVTVDASASEILGNLQFGAMGVVVARKGKWGVGGDAMWMSLGANGTSVPASVDVNQGGFAFYALRSLGPVADLTFGGRVNVMQGNIRVTGPAAIRSADGSKTWFDPLVGLILHTPEGKSRWHAMVYTEIGGFGAGSKIAWQVFPTVGVDVAKRVSLDFGYRWLKTDYETGEGLTFFKYDVLAQGPVLGFAFKF